MKQLREQIQRQKHELEAKQEQLAQKDKMLEVMKQNTMRLAQGMRAQQQHSKQAESPKAPQQQDQKQPMKQLSSFMGGKTGITINSKAIGGAFAGGMKAMGAFMGTKAEDGHATSGAGGDSDASAEKPDPDPDISKMRQVLEEKEATIERLKTTTKDFVQKMKQEVKDEVERREAAEAQVAELQQQQQQKQQE